MHALKLCKFVDGVQPQLFLGLTINWGAFMGWSATTGTVGLPATLPLYLSAVCWTLVYDTIYAHMDRRDDEAAGIKSTARLLGDHTRPVLTGVHSFLTTVACIPAPKMEKLPFVCCVALHACTVATLNHEVATCTVASVSFNASCNLFNVFCNFST
jgi:4-hydroxybenzoate polyprenyltransferase